jgi:hypothetical protein
MLKCCLILEWHIMFIWGKKIFAYKAVVCGLLKFAFYHCDLGCYSQGCLCMPVMSKVSLGTKECGGHHR